MTTCNVLLVESDLEGPLPVAGAPGQTTVYTHRCVARARANQDGAAVLSLQEGEGALFAVADGAGGQPGAERAAATVLQTFVARVGEAGASVRERILRGIEAADQALAALRVGAGCTLAVVHVLEGAMRSYHVGDAGVLLVGQRGRRRYESVPHSPVGYAVHAGVLDEDEAMEHEDRHLVSNLLGSGDANIEMSARVELNRRDTLLLASDGLFDNLAIEEIIETVRKGPMARAAEQLQAESHRRMRAGSDDSHEGIGKPDDLTFVLHRLVA